MFVCASFDPAQMLTSFCSLVNEPCVDDSRPTLCVCVERTPILSRMHERRFVGDLFDRCLSQPSVAVYRAVGEFSCPKIPRMPPHVGHFFVSVTSSGRLHAQEASTLSTLMFYRYRAYISALSGCVCSLTLPAGSYIDYFPERLPGFA